MNKENTTTELVYILDRSGSMAGLENDTIGGYNAMIQRQKETEGEVRITTVLFDDRYELLHDRMPLDRVKPMTSQEYFVRGSTALLDAVGLTIQRIRSQQDHLSGEERSAKVLFVITTDGYENASREYSYETIRELITRQKAVDGWEFLFMGANIDAVKEAARFGIQENRAAQFISDHKGVGLNFKVMSNVVHEFRQSSSIREDWMAPIEADRKKRSKK